MMTRASLSLCFLLFVSLLPASGRADSRSGSIDSSTAGDTSGTGFRLLSVTRDSSSPDPRAPEPFQLKFTISGKFLKHHSIVVDRVREVRFEHDTGSIGVQPDPSGTTRVVFSAVDFNGRSREWQVILKLPGGWVLRPSCLPFGVTLAPKVLPYGRRVEVGCTPRESGYAGSWNEDFPVFEVRTFGARTIQSQAPGYPLKKDLGDKASLPPLWGGASPRSIAADYGTDRTSGLIEGGSRLPFRLRGQFTLGFAGSSTSQNIGSQGFSEPTISAAAFAPFGGGSWEARSEFQTAVLRDSSIVGFQDWWLRLEVRYHLGAFTKDGYLSREPLRWFASLQALGYGQARGDQLRLFQFDPITTLMPGIGVVWQHSRAWRTAAVARIGPILSYQSPSNVPTPSGNGAVIDAGLLVSWVPHGASGSEWFARARLLYSAVPSPDSGSDQFSLGGSWSVLTFDIGWGAHAWPSGTNRWGVGL